MTFIQFIVLCIYLFIFFILIIFLGGQLSIDLLNFRLKRKYGLPYVPTSRKRLRKIMEFAQITSTDKVVDLGSGDGRLVISAAKKGAQADGFELNPVLVWLSRFKIKLFGLSSRGKIYKKDLFKADFNKYNVFLLYTMPWVMDEIQNRLKSSPYDKIRIISNTFQFGNITPNKSAQKEKVYLYEFTKKDLLNKKFC